MWCCSNFNKFVVTNVNGWNIWISRKVTYCTWCLTIPSEAYLDSMGFLLGADPKNGNEKLFENYCYLVYCTPSSFQKFRSKAAAWADGFGFPEFRARPKPWSGRDFGPAWLGLIRPGLAWPTAWSRAVHITRSEPRSMIGRLQSDVPRLELWWHTRQTVVNRKTRHMY